MIQSDTNVSILTLDTKKGELKTLQFMISNVISTKYPKLPLFMSVKKQFWYSQGYHFQFMPYMEEETTMIMHNLIPVLIFKYGDDTKT